MAERILVVDDEASMRRMLEILFKEEGYEVVTADSAEAALQALARKPFDLVLSDIRMPGLTGLDLLRRLKEEESSTEVVLMTAYASTESAIEALKLGAFDYITKPFQVEELRAVVERVMIKKGLARTPEEQLHRLIGDRIRNMRKDQKLTLKQMSKRTGLSVSLLSQIERAESSASIPSLYKIACALDARMQDLFADI